MVARLVVGALFRTVAGAVVGVAAAEVAAGAGAGAGHRLGSTHSILLSNRQATCGSDLCKLPLLGYRSFSMKL